MGTIIGIILIVIILFIGLIFLYGTIIVWMACKSFNNKDDPEALKKWKEQNWYNNKR
jgi:hypothetical protein